MQLPGSYVNEHVTLGYASTVLTRGRETNVVFVVTRNTPADAETGETTLSQNAPPPCWLT